MDDEMRPEDHIDDHGGPIVLMVEGNNGVTFVPEPIEHGFRVQLLCVCGEMWTTTIDFDDMEVGE